MFLLVVVLKYGFGGIMFLIMLIIIPKVAIGLEMMMMEIMMMMILN
jgi:hypothetical protein